MKELDLPYLNLKIIDGIVYGAYKPATIDLPLAKEVVRKRKEFFENKSYPTVILFYNLAKVSKEARDYFNSEEGSKGITAAAFITESIFIRTLINFFTKVNKPRFPVKPFSNVEDGIEWLKQYKEEVLKIKE